MSRILTLVPREQIRNITQDSREVGPGTLFFAIEGTKHDGHDFVTRALELGAVGAVIRYGHPKEAELRKDSKVIGVVDPRQSLGETACEYFGYPSNRMIVCGVTGTNGKTTSTYLLEAILEEWGQNPAVIGTVENRLGSRKIEATHTTPDAVKLQKLLSDFLDQGATALAMEVSSHALDQARTAGMQFTAALFTNLTQDHLDYHKTIEEYYAAKAKLFLDYPVKTRAIHKDDAYGAKLLAECAKKNLKAVSYGRTGCDVNYSELSISAAGIAGDITAFGKKIAIDSKLLGAFNAQNLAGAVAVAVGLGIPERVISQALSSAKQVPGRMEQVPNSRGFTVVVDYAHTPDALENVLKTLKPLTKSKLICVFGCGGDRDSTKRPLMAAIAEKFAGTLVITSDNPRTEDPEKIIKDIVKGLKHSERAKIISDRKQAIADAVQLLAPGDILLIAGKGHEDYQIIGTTKHPFDDRKVALENLEEKS